VTGRRITKKTRRVDALAYLGERTGSIEYRFLRYAAVADELERMGLDNKQLLVDVGAGTCDLDFYMRAVRGWKGRYLPVDASIDGVDLHHWVPSMPIDFAVAIEVLEHLAHPAGLVERIMARTRRLVITTPNTEVLGEDRVLRMDRTHQRPLYIRDLEAMGATRISERSFFGLEADTLLATWEKKA